MYASKICLRFWIFLFISFSFLESYAQNNLPMSYGSGSFFNLQGARYQPSKLGDSYTTLDINIANIYAWVDNSFIGYNSIQKMFITQNIKTEEVNSLVDGLNNRNHLGFGATIQPIGVAIKFTRDSKAFNNNNPDLANYPYLKKDERFTISIEWNERAESNVSFSNVVGELFWYGNRRFAGQTLDLGQLNTNVFYQREFALGIAAPLKVSFLDDKKYDLRVGARAKVIMGILALRTQDTQGRFRTETIENDATISLEDFVYDIRSANANTGNDFNFFKPVGWGLGFDLGATLTYDKHYAVSLSFLDIGAVRYTQNIESYTANSNANFTGITLLGDGQDRPNEVVDSLRSRLQGTQNQNSFTTPLPTRMALQFEYKIPNETQKRRYKYNEHHFYLTYIQGFAQYGAATTRPFFSAGYTYDYRTKFNLGISTSYGGYGRFGLGTWFGFRVGAFRMGIGSSNIAGLISSELGYGADLSFNLGLGFY